MGLSNAFVTHSETLGAILYNAKYNPNFHGKFIRSILRQSWCNNYIRSVVAASFSPLKKESLPHAVDLPKTFWFCMDFNFDLVSNVEILSEKGFLFHSLSAELQCQTYFFLLVLYTCVIYSESVSHQWIFESRFYGNACIFTYIVYMMYVFRSDLRVWNCILLRNISEVCVCINCIIL